MYGFYNCLRMVLFDQGFYCENEIFRTGAKHIYQGSITIGKIAVITTVPLIKKPTESGVVLQTKTSGTNKMHGKLCFHSIMRDCFYVII